MSATANKGTTSEQVQQIINMYEAGWAINFIAKNFKLSSSTVQYYLATRDIPRRPRNIAQRDITRLPHSEYDKTVFLYHNCRMTVAEVAKELGLAKSTVSVRLRRAGAPPRDRKGQTKNSSPSNVVPLPTQYIPTSTDQIPISA